MGRTLDEDGNCYRHTVEYLDAHGNHRVIYFGMYDTTAPAKAKATTWITRGNGRKFTILKRYSEISTEWREV